MSKLQYDLYLSLAMHGRLGRDVIEQTEEAKKFCKIYGVSYYSPCDDEIINPRKIIDAKPDRRKIRRFVHKDDAKVDESLAILHLTGDKSSSGTGWEAGRIHYLHRRHYLLVAPKMACKQLANFSTIKGTKIFHSAEEAIKWVAKNKSRLRLLIPKGEL